MSVVNPIGASSGLTPMIVVTAPTGSTVTCDSVQGTEVSGTWTFKVAVGTHTIVASLNGQTKTESVLVDRVGLFPVTISYKLYLYFEGEEYADITGGWIQGDTRRSTLTKNADNMVIEIGIYGVDHLLCYTNNLLNISAYTKLGLEYQRTYTNDGYGYPCGCGIDSTIRTGYNVPSNYWGVTTDNNVPTDKWFPCNQANNRVSQLYDITQNPYKTSTHLQLYAQCRNTLTVYKVWLE